MSAQFSDNEMQEIFEGFLVETNELLANISTDLMELESHPDNMDIINQTFRSFHTIKGTSSFMGFDDISKITHHAEDILNKLRRAEFKVNQPIIDVLLEVHDWIEKLIDNLIHDHEEVYDFTATIDRIEKLKEQGGGQVSEEAKPEISQPTAQPFEDGKKALDMVLENKELVTKPGDFTDDELSLIEAAFQEVNKKFFEDQGDKKIEIPDVFQTVATVTTAPVQVQAPIAEKTPEPEKQVVQTQPKVENQDNPAAPKTNTATTNLKGKAAADTIRIDVNRIETLMDLSGELVLGRNRLAQITDLVESEFEKNKAVSELIETTAQIDFITSEIQAAVMKMRMVPVGKLYQKAPRIVRDLSKEFNKKINLEVKGEDTEIDRGIIEELNDPLVHMIRNSCDHGIESPEERVALGKPQFGTITLDAEQEGNAIVMKISDDGKGMDAEKLKAKALEKGIITEEYAQQMSQREIYQLIFSPGFSTAAKVTAVSGRGVGMDVVRTNIQNLKGMIEIETELGKGSTFIIKLPLTLAIIQGLLVKLQEETYAVPLSSVVEVVAIDPEKIYTVNKQEVIRIRKDVLPLVRLDKTLGIAKPIQTLEKRYVVVVGLGYTRVGFVVDELMGQQEIVIKSLGDYLGHLNGIAGSTILGDGRVIMIIDAAELVQNSYSEDFRKINALI